MVQLGAGAWTTPGEPPVLPSIPPSLGPEFEVVVSAVGADEVPEAQLSNPTGSRDKA